MNERRRKDLIGILREGHSSSQHEIVAALRGAGHDVTQATVSRDLRDLGAVKVHGRDGLTYRLPDEVPRSVAGDLTARNLRRTLEDFALAINPAGSLVVLTTAPGHAGAVARALDLAAEPGVVGTIAGDDTIFIATPDPATAEALAGAWGSLGSEGDARTEVAR